MVSVSERMHDFGWAVKAFNENKYSFVNLYITYDYLRRCIHNDRKQTVKYIVNHGFASQDELDHFRDTANNYRHAKNTLGRAEMQVADAMLLMMKLIESIAIDRFRALSP